MYKILHIESGRFVCFFDPKQSIPKDKKKIKSIPPKFWLNTRKDTMESMKIPDFIVHQIRDTNSNKMWKRLGEGAFYSLRDDFFTMYTEDEIITINIDDFLFIEVSNV